MNYIYVTTDSSEAKHLIEGSNIGQKPEYEYHDFSVDNFNGLVKLLGFNPMSSVKIRQKLSDKEISNMVRSLSSKGLYVASEIKNDIKIYKPCDFSERESLVKSSLQANNQNAASTAYLLRYSNNPNKIFNLLYL